MERSQYVIVGNGFAGTTCAEQLRKADAACFDRHVRRRAVSALQPDRAAAAAAQASHRGQSHHSRRRLAREARDRPAAEDARRRDRLRGRKRRRRRARSIRTTRCSWRPAAARIRSEFPARRARRTSSTFSTWTTPRRSPNRSRRAKVGGRGRRLVHRLRAGRSVRLARRRDALADPRTALPAPHARRDLGRTARRGGARGRLHDPLRR